MASSVDLSDNRQPSLYASSTIPFFFGLLCVILRFWCRWTKRAGFWIDDWLILFALVNTNPYPLRWRLLNFPLDMCYRAHCQYVVV